MNLVASCHNGDKAAYAGLIKAYSGRIFASDSPCSATALTRSADEHGRPRPLRLRAAKSSWMAMTAAGSKLPADYEKWLDCEIVRIPQK
jgi:hypothetical protein